MVYHLATQVHILALVPYRRPGSEHAGRNTMNAFNRAVMIISILIALLVVVIFMLLVAFRPLQAFNVLRDGLDRFERAVYDEQFFAIFMATLGAFLLFFALVLWLEMRRPRYKTVRIRTKGRGAAQLGTHSVLESLHNRIDELPGVREVRPRVVSRGRDVEVSIDLDTGPSVNVPELTGKVVDLCHDIVEGQLGVRIHGKVKVAIEYEPLPRGTMAIPAAGPEAPRPEPAPTQERRAGRKPAAVAPEAEPAPEPDPEPPPDLDPVPEGPPDDGLIPLGDLGRNGEPFELDGTQEGEAE